MTDTLKIDRELLKRVCDLLANLAPLHSAESYAVDDMRELLAQPAEQNCKWVRDEDTGAYETDCGSTWHLSDGGEPEEHGQYYCHHCGKPIDDEVHADED